MLLSKKQVRERTTLSNTHIDRLEDAGQFPKRTRLGPFPNSRVAWCAKEVDLWCHDRLAERFPHG